MIRKTGLLACVFVVGLSGLACQPLDRSAETATPWAAGAGPLPAKAFLSLAELSPVLQRPANAPDAEKLPRRVAKTVIRAEALIAGGDYARAIDLLERAAEFAPNSPRVRRQLGLAYYALGNRAKAFPNLLKAVVKAPDNVRIQLLLGMYAAAERRFDEAAVRLRTALMCSDAADENPDTGEAVMRLGMILESRGYLTAALECYRRLGGLISAHGRAYSNRPILKIVVARPERYMSAQGKVLLKLHKPGEAAVLLERAYRLDKTAPRAGRLAVAALLADGDFERSRAIVMEMLQEPSLRAEAIASAAQWCRARKDPSAPLTLLQQHLDESEADSAFVITMAEVAADLGGTAQADRILTTYISKVPTDPATAMRLVRLRARTGNLAAAARLLATLLRSETVTASRVREEINELARRGLGKGFMDELAQAVSRAGELKPAMLCVSALLADATGQGDKAVGMLRQAVRTDPKFWPAYEFLEDIHVAGGDFEAVDALARQVSQAAGDGYFRFYFIGKSRFDRGRFAAAINNLEQAYARNARHVSTLVLLGRAYVRRGRFSEAENVLRLARKIAPNDTTAARVLFGLYMKQTRRAEARQVVLALLQHSRGSIQARVLLGRFYFMTDQTGRARSLVRALMAQAPENIGVRLLDLLIYLPESVDDEPIAAAEAASALKKVRQILRLDERNVPAGRFHASILTNQGKHAQAAKAWASLHRRMPYDVGTASAYLGALIDAGMDDQAAAVTEEIYGREVTDPAMRMLVLETLLRIKRYGQAEGLADKWLAAPASKVKILREKELAMLRLQAMKTYEAARHYDKAQRLLDSWIALKPERGFLSSLRREKLRIYGMAGQYDEATAYAEQWIRSEPPGDDAKGILIAVLAKAEQFDLAHAAVDGWLAAGGQPDTMSKLRTAKLLLYARHEQFKRLMDFGRKWIALDPGAAVAYESLLTVLIRNEKYDRALAIAEEWLSYTTLRSSASPRSTSQRKSHPAGEKDAFKARSAVVEVLLLAGREREALARARSYVQAQPKRVEALKILKNVLMTSGEDAEATAVLGRIYKLDPDDPGINNDLGYFWADRGVNLQKAESMIRKALAAEPGKFNVQDSLGWVLYKQGRFAEAKIVFDRVVSAAEARLHPVILDHAGDLHWRLGLKRKAIAFWRRAVKTAKKEKAKIHEIETIVTKTPGKIQAARRGSRPAVAPLGQGVRSPMDQ